MGPCNGCFYTPLSYISYQWHTTISCFLAFIEMFRGPYIINKLAKGISERRGHDDNNREIDGGMCYLPVYLSQSKPNSPSDDSNIIT